MVLAQIFEIKFGPFFYFSLEKTSEFKTNNGLIFIYYTTKSVHVLPSL